MLIPIMGAVASSSRRTPGSSATPPPTPAINIRPYESMEKTAEHISEVIHRLSFTGILGVSLIASSFQPDTSVWPAAVTGAVLVLPAAAAIRKWVKSHQEYPAPLREVLPLVAKQTPPHYFEMGRTAKTLWWTAVGVAACVSTMLAARIATPDYDYQQLEFSTSVTRLQEARPKAAAFVLEAAQTTVQRLKASNPSPTTYAKIKSVEQAKVAYMLYASQSTDPKVQQGVWSEEAQIAIRTDPTLQQNLPETLKAQYVEQAKQYIASFATVKPIYTYSTPHTVGYTEKDHFQHAFRQLCTYANNPETQQLLNNSWQSLAQMKYKNGKSSPVSFVERVKQDGYTSCDNSYGY